jgi:hypothetical protein
LQQRFFELQILGTPPSVASLFPQWSFLPEQKRTRKESQWRKEKAE